MGRGWAEGGVAGASGRFLSANDTAAFDCSTPSACSHQLGELDSIGLYMLDLLGNVIQWRTNFPQGVLAEGLRIYIQRGMKSVSNLQRPYQAASNFRGPPRLSPPAPTHLLKHDK